MAKKPELGKVQGDRRMMTGPDKGLGHCSSLAASDRQQVLRQEVPKMMTDPHKGSLGRCLVLKDPDKELDRALEDQH
jgi:hypothetical protein